MKTKTLLFSMALIACTFFTANAQKLILSEDFSTPEWQAEILRLNPGADEFGVPLNSNSTNPFPFAPPSSWQAFRLVHIPTSEYCRVPA